MTADEPPRVFISYAWDSPEHKDLVLQFATFLRVQVGIDVHLDRWYEGHRRDWAAWASEHLRNADFILVIASPAYRRRSDGQTPSREGRGSQFEAAIIRDNLFRNLCHETQRVLPVVLPGGSVDDIPTFLCGHSTSHYRVDEFTLDGLESLRRAFSGHPLHPLPHRGPYIALDSGIAVDATILSAWDSQNSPTPTPRQLHPAPTGFVGRDNYLAELDSHTLTTPGASTSNPGGDSVRTLAVCAISGTGGIGKTWLALTWAHRHLDQFPDGQLFVDLHGFSPTDPPTAPEEALRGFLEALGVARSQQPSTIDALVGKYRSLVANKRMLIVLDNAATTDQVIPLLPASPKCTVLVTSRNRLVALLARHGVRSLRIDVLNNTECRDLLIAALGPDRITTVERTAAELITLCRGFPLALSLIATRIAAEPHLPLDDTVAALRNLGLAALDSDDHTASLPAVLSWSLRHLTEYQRTVFALLGIAPGQGISLPAAASLVGMPTREVHAVLRELADASLITLNPGSRFAMHDLVRAYAATHALATLSKSSRCRALERVVDFYLRASHAADQLLDPHREPIQPRLSSPGVALPALVDFSAALAWFDAERLCVRAAQRAANIHGNDQAVWQLAWSLDTFHLRRGSVQDRIDVWRAGLVSAEKLEDPTACALAHRFLGRAFTDRGRLEIAISHLQKALALAEHRQDYTAQAHTHRALARAWSRKGHPRQALQHASHALDLHRALNQPVWEAHALNSVGQHASQLGDHHRARAHCEAALTLHRRHHNPAGEASTLDNLGGICQNSGNHHWAVRYYRQALTLYQELRNAYSAANTLDQLGHANVALDRHDQARLIWQDALKLYQTQQRAEAVDRVQRQLDNLDAEHARGLSNFTLPTRDARADGEVPLGRHENL